MGTPESIASYLLPVVKVLDGKGVDSRALLQQAGVEDAVSNDPLERLPHDRMGEVFRLAVEARDDPQFGLYASRYMLPAHIHAPGSAMLASHSSEQLLEKLPTASPELAHLADQVVRDYLAKMNKDDIVSRLSRLLVANLPTGEYSKEDAAVELNMSPRTLQKKLLEAGTSWREQVDSTRYGLAASYLQSGRYSLSEITYMLGFNDTSSFSRAFKRWSGKAPGSFT